MSSPDPLPADARPAPAREYQELWFTLARRNWRSVMLVPVDAGTSVANIATSLADVGRWLRVGLVTLYIMSDPLDYSFAAQNVTRPSAPAVGPESESRSERSIIAVQPVIVEPLALALAQAADAVVLCVEMGRSRMAAARRTIDLIGRDRVTGCLLIR